MARRRTEPAEGSDLVALTSFVGEHGRVVRGEIVRDDDPRVAPSPASFAYDWTPPIITDGSDLIALSSFMTSIGRVVRGEIVKSDDPRVVMSPDSFTSNWSPPDLSTGGER